MGLSDETRRTRARNLRYKRPMLPGMCLDAIRCWLYEALEECGEWTWADETKRDLLIDALDGDDEEYASYQMLFAKLEDDLERFQTALETYAPLDESFDDVMAAYHMPGAMTGYDDDVGDYMPLESDYETRLAQDEAQKRLQRYTKAQLFELMGMCTRIVLDYMALRHRLDDLGTARDLLRGVNFDRAQDAKDISAAYDELEAARAADGLAVYDAESKFDMLADKLLPEAWLR